MDEKSGLFFDNENIEEELEGLFLAVNYRKKNNALLKSSGSMVLHGLWFSAILQKQYYKISLYTEHMKSTYQHSDKNSEEYQRWRADHNNTCKANFICSAPAMEPERVYRIFSRFQASYLPECRIL